MTPERWQEVKKVLAGALERTPEERRAYLDQACAEPDMRREVESLILAHEQSNRSFLEQPAQLEDLPIGSRLGSYEILALIGAGGMGEVYRARDTRLDRIVAIKVLPVHLADRPELRERFQREARTIASLNHPHICTLYDVGHQDGTDYLVMEYLEGETLAQRLLKGPLPMEQVLQYAIEIADALDKAQRKGVTHRDLKPGNIMLTKSGTKLLDFGLAKLKQEVAPANVHLSQLPTANDPLTAQGAIVGTLQYMAPEQLEAKEVDARTDIFAFGAVVYEMATGKKAFEGKSQASLIAKILETDPPPISSLQPMTPPALDRTIKTCLAKDPDERWQTASDLARELKWIAEGGSQTPDRVSTSAPQTTAVAARLWWRGRVAMAVAAVALLAVLATAVWLYRSRMGGGETIDSVAVLPFVNANADPNTEYLSDGISESLINSLSQLPHLKVMSRDSAFRYKGKQTDAETVGRELGVRAVFEGRIMQHGDDLEVSAELVDARDDSHIWGEKYSRKSADIFALQGDLAREMTTALRMHLTGEDEERMAKGYTPSPEAYQLYLKGQYSTRKFTKEGLQKGQEYFQQAIAVDPNYALPYNGLAYNYGIQEDWIAPPRDVMPKARAAAERAVQLDDTFGDAHANVAYVHFFYDYNFPAAEKEFRRAIELSPNDVYAHEMYGWSLVAMKRFDEGTAENERARSLDPLSVEANVVLGMNLYWARRYDQAIEQLRNTIDLAPDLFAAHDWLGLSYAAEGRLPEAIAEHQKALQSAGTIAVPLASLGRTYALQGKVADARKVLDELNGRSKGNYVSPYYFAAVYAGLGDKDQAIASLEKAYEERSWDLVELAVDPQFDNLRSDLRFADLVRRVGLPQ